MNYILLLLSGFLLLAALLILCLMALSQKRYSLIIFFPILGGLLYGGWLSSQASYIPGKAAWGINECIQDKISRDFGLEKFYHMALKNIENESDRIHWFWDFRDTIKDQTFIGIITYSQNRLSQPISLIQISPEKIENENSSDKIAWNSNYTFYSEEEMIKKILTQTTLKRDIIILTIIFMTLLVVSYKFIRYSNTNITVIYLVSLVLIPFSLLYIVMTNSPGLYFTPSDQYFKQFSDGQLVQHISELNHDEPQAGTVEWNHTDFNYFTCESTFFTGKYIRINIDLFQYLYYAKNEDQITRSSQMELINLGHHLYLGKYYTYMKESTYTTIFLFSVWLVNLFSLTIFYIMFLRRQKKMKTNDLAS